MLDISEWSSGINVLWPIKTNDVWNHLRREIFTLYINSTGYESALLLLLTLHWKERNPFTLHPCSYVGCFLKIILLLWIYFFLFSPMQQILLLRSWHHKYLCLILHSWAIPLAHIIVLRETFLLVKYMSASTEITL